MAFIPLLPVVMLSLASPAPVQPRDAAVERVAQFRIDARQVYGYLQLGCPMTFKPELLKQYEPLNARLATIEARAAGTRFAEILADVQAGLIATMASADCGHADGPGVTAASIAAMLEPIPPALDRMERAVSTRQPRRRQA
jgi:hypothetical protein